MKKLAIFLVLFPVLTFGQGAMAPSKSVLSVVNGVTRPIANATVTVCAALSSGIPCSPPLSNAIFSNTALTVPLSNPFTSDENGNYQFAIATGNYTVTESASGYAGYSYQVSIGGCATASSSSLGCVQPDNTTITINDGVISSVGGAGITITTVAGLASVPGKTNGTVASVTNGASATDCTAGGGAFTVLCQYNGSTWSAVSSSSIGYPAVGIPVSTGSMWTVPSLVQYGTQLGVPTCADPGTVSGVLLVADGSHGCVPASGSFSSNGTAGSMISINQLLSAPTQPNGGLGAGLYVYNNVFNCILANGTSCSPVSSLAGSLGLASGPNALTMGFANSGSGTSAGLIAVLVAGSNDTVQTAPTNATQIAGICVSGCSTSGIAQIAVAGTAACTFQNAATVGDYVQALPSGLPFGDCYDAGSTYPTSGSMIVGTVADGGAAGTHNVFLWLAPVAGSVSIQTNGSANSSQAVLNLSTSTANAVGLVVTPVYSSGGVEKFEISGSTYTGNAATATSANQLNGVTISGTPAAGYVPVASNASTAAWSAQSGGGGPVASAAASVSLTTSTDYQALEGSGNSTTIGNVAQALGAAPASISQLKVVLSAAISGSQTLTVTLYDVTASAAEAVTCQVPNSGSNCSDVTHSYSVPAGHLMVWQIVLNTSTATETISIGAQVGSASTFSGNLSTAVSASSGLAGAAANAPVWMDGSGNATLATCNTAGVCGIWSNGLSASQGLNVGTATQTLGTGYGTVFIPSTPFAMSLGHATFDVTVLQASAIFYVCLYNAAGSSLLSSGSGSAASTGGVSASMSGSVTIEPGVEYLLVWGTYGSASAPTFDIFSDSAATINIVNKQGTRHFTTGNNLSAGPGCPATTGTLTASTVDGVAIMLEP